MEKPLKSFKELDSAEEGTLLLIDNPLVGEEVAVVAFKMKELKYPFSDEKGRKSRSDGKNFIYADEENATGDEEIWVYELLGENGGNYSFKEDDDPTNWNIRMIDESHPKYNKNAVSAGKETADAMKIVSEMISKHFGE